MVTHYPRYVHRFPIACEKSFDYFYFSMCMANLSAHSMLPLSHVLNMHHSYNGAPSVSWQKMIIKVLECIVINFDTTSRFYCATCDSTVFVKRT